MTIECGYLLRQETEGKPTVFHGELENVQGIGGEIYLIPHASRRSDRSPDFAFKIRSRDGGFMHFGNAWTKKFKDGSGEFFSITIDGPGMAAPVYVSAYPDDEQPKDAKHPANYTIRWGRPRGGRPTAPVPNQAAQVDEIPWN